ncbi:MAG: SusE domain-containing protein [Bacteroides graminisolvens]|nr:SusE domain-containing protein [Bacteroides graminisolvens]
MKAYKIYKNVGLAFTAILTLLSTSCTTEIDNLFSRNHSEIQLEPSGEYIKLDESKADETAFTLSWSPAHDFGDEYITTYKYKMQLIGSNADDIEEYEDDSHFLRSYTNKEMQDILVNHFGLTTSTVGEVLFTITASFEGPRLIVPDIATATLHFKTYGPKQFAADHLYIAGTAVGSSDVELTCTDTDNKIYTYEGPLVAGSLNFPVTNADENNAIGPETADEATTLSEMPAIITDRSEANSWVISEENTYRVSVNLTKHTVKIIAAGAVVDADQLFLAGTAVGAGQIELGKTLENDNLYAWRGHLTAGSLYVPLTFEGEQQISIVPQVATSHDIEDGITATFAQTNTTNVNSRHWTIPSEGDYRIVLDKENKTITIYSATTDLKPQNVSWNNTTLGINPYKQDINVLYMYGTFNGFAYDAGSFTGYESKYNLIQSVANPCVFVYKGSALPRGSAKDERGNSVVGSVKFTTDNKNNNVYAFGSTADAKRNEYNGYVNAVIGKSEGLKAGQADNRYAYFIIPDGCNYVVVDINKLTVTFDKK